MQRFYNKIELKTVVEASKRVLQFLSSFKSGSYPESIRLDITLLSLQVRNMLEVISIDPLTLADDEVQTLMSNYMNAMGNDKVIVKQQASTAKVNNDAARVASPKPLNEPVNGMNRSTSASKNISTSIASAPSPAQNRSKIDRTTKLNDIIDSKSPVHQPSTNFKHLPNPRDPRLRTIEAKQQQIDCLDVVDMELEVVDMEIDRSGSDTEQESDDDCQIVGIYTID